MLVTSLIIGSYKTFHQNQENDIQKMFARSFKTNDLSAVFQVQMAR